MVSCPKQRVSLTEKPDAKSVFIRLPQSLMDWVFVWWAIWPWGVYNVLNRAGKALDVIIYTERSRCEVVNWSDCQIQSWYGGASRTVNTSSTASVRSLIQLAEDITDRPFCPNTDKNNPSSLVAISIWGPSKFEQYTQCRKPVNAGHLAFKLPEKS